MINPERAITPTVAGVAQIPTNLPHLRMPLEWFNHISLPDGKPAMNAMAILSDAVFWYSPKEIIDPRSNRVVGYERKFSGEILQRSYADYEKSFGFSVPQSRYALDILEGIGVLRRVVRERVEVTLPDGQTKVLSNVMYIDLDPKRLYEITVPEALRLPLSMEGGLIYRSDPLLYRSDPLCYTDQTNTDIYMNTESITNAPDGGLTSGLESQSGTATATFTMPGLPGFQNRRLAAIQLRLAEAGNVGLTAVTLREAADALAKIYGVEATIAQDNAMGDNELARQQDFAISLAGMGIKTPEQIQKLYDSWMREDDLARKITANGQVPKPPKGSQLVNHASWLKQEGRLDDAGNITPLPDIAGNGAGDNGNQGGTRHRSGSGATGRPTGERGVRTAAVTRTYTDEELESLGRKLQERLALDDTE